MKYFDNILGHVNNLFCIWELQQIDNIEFPSTKYCVKQILKATASINILCFLIISPITRSGSACFLSLIYLLYAEFRTLYYQSLDHAFQKCYPALIDLLWYVIYHNSPLKTRQETKKRLQSVIPLIYTYGVSFIFALI